jgi:pimeloyl-ACP methyl ester carboxylesterase
VIQPDSRAAGASQFATINGYRLRYRLQGAGPLAVFGHALFGSIEQIDEALGDAVGALAEHVRLLLYDARGHGQSDGPRAQEGYSWEALGRDLTAMAALAGEPRAIVGGASMGAAAALWAAVEQPEAVRALVLIAPPPLGGGLFQGPAEQAAIQRLDALSRAVETFGVDQALAFARQFPGFDERQGEWLKAQNPLAIGPGIRGLLSAPGHHPDAYRRITAPTLVVAHEGEALHPLRAAQLLADHIPGARLVVGPDPDYWWMHRDALLAELLDFLAAIG